MFILHGNQCLRYSKDMAHYLFENLSLAAFRQRTLRIREVWCIEDGAVPVLFFLKGVAVKMERIKLHNSI